MEGGVTATAACFPTICRWTLLTRSRRRRKGEALNFSRFGGIGLPLGLDRSRDLQAAQVLTNQIAIANQDAGITIITLQLLPLAQKITVEKQMTD